LDFLLLKLISLDITDESMNKINTGGKLRENCFSQFWSMRQEDSDQPIESFCKQVKTALEEGNYRQLLVDLRNNSGGSDGVLIRY
jgi:hypothetical protein